MEQEIPKEFEEIRCYSSADMTRVFDLLLADEQFCAIAQQLFEGMTVDTLKQQLYACPDILSFQRVFLYTLIDRFIEKCADDVILDAHSITDKTKPYTFISNHRDIVLDPAFLGYLLLENKFPTTQEIAIGDNLLIYPWIKHLVRLNKAFIVKRSLGLRETLVAGQLMSKYMHYVIREKKNPIWIAQREGRAKDSNDRTQESVLKMIALAGEGDAIERLLEMNIVPLSISYEYDPCDYLKAQEFQLKRDCPNHKKSKADDLLNMKTGIIGYKGRVRFNMSACINPWLEQQAHLSKNELFTALAQHIDQEIYKNYTFYPNNYIAADLLSNTPSRQAHYTSSDKDKFEAYIDNQIKKIELPQKDELFLRTKILEMYANPLFNYEKIG